MSENLRSAAESDALLNSRQQLSKGASHPSPWMRFLNSVAEAAEEKAAQWDEGSTNNVRAAKYAEGVRVGARALHEAEQSYAAEAMHAQDLLDDALTVIGSVNLVLGYLERQVEIASGGTHEDEAVATAYADAVARLKAIEGLE